VTVLRVVQIDGGREWRGGQNQVRLLCRELTRDPAVAQRLATRAAGPLATRAAADGVTVEGLPWGPGLDPRAVWRLRSLVRAFRPHILHAHDSHALTVALVARWLARARRPRPLAVATRRVDFHVRAGSAWHRADHIIAVSAAVQRVLAADGIPAARLSVVADGVDPEEVRLAARRPLDIRGRLGLPPGIPLAVNVAALVPHKDQATLIRAAAAARALRPDLHWVIAGAGELRGTLEHAVAALGVGDRVHLVGYVEEADALIAEADVLVMSSREEGLGSVVLNALALGRPVVATRAGGLPEMLPPAALVGVGDAEGLARKVAQTLTAPPVTVALPDRFTARSMAAAVLARYRALT
jgi:glycosyltransferase involved in cell wall biosynthesis